MGVVTGVFQYTNGSPVANAAYQWKLSNDAILFSGTTACVVPPIVAGSLDANGNMTSTFAFNDVLSTTAGATTYYQLSVKAQNGGQVWNEYYYLTGTAANLNLIPPAGLPVIVTTPVSSVLLQTNNVSNANQVKLNQLNGPGVSLSADGAGGVTFAANLVAGTNVTLATSTANAITISSSGGGGGGGPVFSTAGQGGFWGPGARLADGAFFLLGLQDMYGSSATATSNTILRMQFDLLGTYVIRRVSWLFGNMSTVTGAAAFAIYDSAAANLLLDSGPLTYAGSQVVISSTLGAAVTLAAGVYTFAQAGSPASGAAPIIGAAFAEQNTLVGVEVYYPVVNKNANRLGWAANPWSGTAFPASLGAFTALTGTAAIASICMPFFEP